MSSTRQVKVYKASFDTLFGTLQAFNLYFTLPKLSYYYVIYYAIFILSYYYAIVV